MLTVPTLFHHNKRLVNAFHGLTRRLQTTVEAVRVFNTTGADMARGDLVYLVGDRLVELASTASTDAAFAIGSLVQDIPDGGSGICRTDNRAWVRFIGGLNPVAGTRVYISATPGAAQDSAPGTVDFSIGIISNAAPYVDPTNLFCWVLLDRCCPPTLNAA